MPCRPHRGQQERAPAGSRLCSHMVKVVPSHRIHQCQPDPALCVSVLHSDAGHHCPPASTHPIPCRAGELQPESGKGECRLCRGGQHSVIGSVECTLCAEGYYKDHEGSPAADCRSCNDNLMGVRCAQNTTVRSLMLLDGYWRHSTWTIETHRCKHDGDWTPCRGGIDAGRNGEGYCANETDGGYTGPRCELCIQERHYFDKIEVRCKACGDTTAMIAVVSCVL
eukprot:91731-Prymnesium_polylepis.1